MSVRGIFILASFLKIRRVIGSRVLCFFGENCIINHPFIIVTYRVEKRKGSPRGEVEELLMLLRRGGYPRPLYVLLDSGGFQLLTGKAESTPEGVVNSALLISDALGGEGVVYMNLLDYPASQVDMPRDEFERRLEKTFEYYSRQLDYYYKGGRERENIRVMMPVHGGTPERVEQFMRRVSPLIRDYGITGFAVTGITGFEVSGTSWFSYMLSRISSLSRGVLDSGSRIIDFHFLGFFDKRLWLAGAFAQIPELRTVTADTAVFAEYARRHSFIISSIPSPVEVSLKEVGVIPCNCPICRVVRESGLEEKLIQGVKDYTFLLKLHNIYEYLRFAEVAFRLPKIGIEALGLNYDSLMEKVRMALRGEIEERKGILKYLKTGK